MTHRPFLSLFLSLILVTILTGCSGDTAVSPSVIPPAALFPTLTVQPTASPETLAQVLFEQYLLPYQDNPSDPQAKLFAYEIEKVEIPEKWQPCAELHKAEFIAVITFSVKPERWPPPRWAYDGTLTDDHWINGKRASIAVFRSGQDYKMELLGIPICPGY